MARKKKKQWRIKLPRLSPLVWSFLAGGVVVFLILGLCNRILWGHHSESGERDAKVTAAEQSRRVEQLATLLHPLADWDATEVSCPLEWKGRIPSSESLVQWNAWASSAMQSLGLEVFAGTEEIIERRGRWPLQRLTLIGGISGETLATIVIETPRRQELPPAF